MNITSSKQVYSCRLFQVTEDEASDQSGFTIHRSVVRHPGSAVMMAIENERVLLVHQYRLPAKKMMWELPAGKMDPGETVEETAKRELAEETGYSAKSWQKLVSYFPSPGFVEERMTLFVAQDLTAGTATPMDDERIEMRWFSFAEMRDMIRKNEIEDGKTITGFLMWEWLQHQK